MSKRQETRQAIAAKLLGNVPPEQAAQIEQQLAADPDARQWQERLQGALRELPALKAAVPEDLDRTVRRLIQQDAPENPWHVLWETASQLPQVRMSIRIRQVDTRALREAAELETVAREHSLEQVVKEQLGPIQEVPGAHGDKVFLATVDANIRIGVALSGSSVPIAGVEVQWTSADNQSRHTRTDMRGVFAIGAHGLPAISVRVGAPVNVECALQ